RLPLSWRTRSQNGRLYPSRISARLSSAITQGAARPWSRHGVLMAKDSVWGDHRARATVWMKLQRLARLVGGWRAGLRDVPRDIRGEPVQPIEHCENALDKTEHTAVSSLTKLHMP